MTIQIDFQPKQMTKYHKMQTSTEIEAFLATLPDGLEAKLTKDVGGGMKLYHYEKPTNPTREGVEMSLQQLRGVVVDTKTDHVIARSFPFTPEYVVDGTQQYPFSFENARFFNSYEGTIIRVFWYTTDEEQDLGRWCVSTHKKIDAYKSNWGSTRSFGQEFQGVVETCVQKPMQQYFDETLIRGQTHVFLLRTNPYNFIVSDPPQSPFDYIYQLGSFSSFRADQYLPPISQSRNHTSTPVVEDQTVPIFTPFTFNTPEELTFSNATEFEEYVKGLNTNVQGVFVVENTPEKSTHFYKYVNAAYHRCAELRGNEPNLLFRYIELYCSDSVKAARLKELYPMYRVMFQFVNSQMPVLAKFIYIMYVRRFIRKQHAIVPKVIYPFQMQLQAHYRAEHDPITLEFVTQKLRTTDPRWIAKMIHANLVY